MILGKNNKIKEPNACVTVCMCNGYNEEKPEFYAVTKRGELENGLDVKRDIIYNWKRVHRTVT